MEYVDCYLPDVNFRIQTEKCNMNIVKKKIYESIIDFKKNSERIITIEYIVDKEMLSRLIKMINLEKGIIYNNFEEQKHKEVFKDNKYYYLINTEEYSCIKINETKYKIIVKENTEESAMWIIRIIREIYLREKEDKSFCFIHANGLEIDGKGIILLGAKNSGKTTLSTKILEYDKKKKFLSNDRVLINHNLIVDYFPQSVTLSMRTVKNNKSLDKYFKTNRVLENKKKLNYKNVKDDIKCNISLMDIIKIFPETEMIARTKLNLIICPEFDKSFSKVEVTNMFFEEKRELLENQNFTPDDTECYRKPWIRKRHIDINEIVSNKEKLKEKLLNEVKMIRLKYGERVKIYDIMKKLEEWNN